MTEVVIEKSFTARRHHGDEGHGGGRHGDRDHGGGRHGDMDSAVASHCSSSSSSQLVQLPIFAIKVDDEIFLKIFKFVLTEKKFSNVVTVTELVVIR